MKARTRMITMVKMKLLLIAMAIIRGLRHMIMVKMKAFKRVVIAMAMNQRNAENLVRI